MDILREKAQLEAQKLVTPNTNPELERQLEELKTTDPDKWFQERKRLEEEYQRAVQQKADELYKQYKMQEQLEKAKVSEDELKSKLTAEQYEQFKAGNLDLEKVLKPNDGKTPKDGNNNGEDNTPPKSKNQPPIDLTKQKGSPTPLEDEKTLEELYINGTF